MSTDTVLDRRNLSLRDLVLLLVLLGGLVANYAAISSRIAVVEAKVDLLQRQMDRVYQPGK